VPEHLAFDPNDLTPAQLAQIFDEAVAPRPIALVSTLGEAGRPWLHPVSWYSSAAVNPPVQYFAVTEQHGAAGALLLEQIRRHREFVLNAVDDRVAQALPALAGGGGFLSAGLLAAPSVRVAPYRVTESPAQMECRLLDLLPVGGGASHLVLGAVTQFHVREDLNRDGRIDQLGYAAVGRLGGDRYCRCVELYRMRPGEGT
jgi:flavin reductase (DIM6/NTAB) family NADH-FMN oxidoreductase RutF